MKRLVLILLVQLVFTATAIAGGNAMAGKEKSQACVACHGETGMSAAPTFPNIAGQYEDYLYVSLKSYKSGDRNNAIMSGIVATLSDQDMKDLAAYYAAQDGLYSFGLPEK
jgi:cytochrome c553